MFQLGRGLTVALLSVGLPLAGWGVYMGAGQSSLASAALAQSPAPPAQMAQFSEHPEINDALDSLQRARRHLKEADHDFGGHRDDAIRAIDKAIEQLKIALKYDRH